MKKTLAFGALAWVSAAEGAKRPASTFAVLGPVLITMFALFITGIAWIFSGSVLPEHRLTVLVAVFLLVLVPLLVLNRLFVSWLRRVEYTNAVNDQIAARQGYSTESASDRGVLGLIKDPVGTLNDTVDTVRRRGGRTY